MIGLKLLKKAGISNVFLPFYIKQKTTPRGRLPVAISINLFFN